MSKSFSKQVGSMLAHIQDLMDTVIQGLLKSSKKKSDNKIVRNMKDAGESYYETYESIKGKKGKS